jgi:hypothetical protein
MSHAREHRDLSVAHATEPSWMFQSSSKSGGISRRGEPGEVPNQIDAE